MRWFSCSCQSTGYGHRPRLQAATVRSPKPAARSLLSSIMSAMIPVLLLIAALFQGAIAAPAQTPQTPRPRLPGEDWVPLFNGTDLAGWNNVGKEKWTVEN